MKFESFRIKNIKSIIDSGKCFLSSDNITVLAGQNEAGKSAILESLHFFTNGMNEKFEKYSMRIDKTVPFVECSFKLEEDDTEYKNENISKVLRAMSHIICNREGNNDISFSETTKSELIETIKKLASEKSIDNIFADSEELLENQDCLTRKESVEDFAKKIEEAVLKYLPKFDYYNSFDNILPETIKITEIDNNPAVKDFQVTFDIDLKEYVKLPIREKSQQKQKVEQELKIDFNDCWTQKLTGEDANQYNFILQDGPEGISFLIDRGNGQHLFFNQKSKGFRWFIAFYLRLKALQKKTENLSDYILLIDEPGQGLHEKAQYDVKNVLEELSVNGMQIVYTTHHPQLVDVNDKITRLRLVYQNITDGTKVCTLSQMASQKGQQTLDTLSPIRTAMGLANFSCFDFENNKNLIVEGITDKYYIETFLKLLKIPSNVNIIPSCGCENIKNIASILLGWGCSFKILLDKGDGAHPREECTQKIISEKLLAYDQELEKKILKRLSQVAIEDAFSKNDFRKYVKPDDVSHGNKNNVNLAKDYGKKELWARLFVEKVNNMELTIEQFEQETIDNFSEIIEWIVSD